MRLAIIGFWVLGLAFVLSHSLPALVAFVMGLAFAPSISVLNIVLYDAGMLTILVGITAWWWKEKPWLKESPAGTGLPKTTDALALFLGTFLVGAIFGITLYDSAWGFNNILFVPSRDLRINGPEGAVYMLVFSVGIVLLFIGFFRVFLKGNVRAQSSS